MAFGGACYLLKRAGCMGVAAVTLPSTSSVDSTKACGALDLANTALPCGPVSVLPL